MNIYVLDTQMGVSGDMLLAAMLDLDMIPKQKFVKVLESIGNVWTKTNITIKEDLYYGIAGKKLNFKFEDIPHIHNDGVPATVVLEYFDLAIEEIGISKSRSLARKILDTILDAEMKVHRCDLEKLHLHETGSPDTLIDILGFIYFYDENKIHSDEIFCTPTAVGQGIWKGAHGYFSVPAPASLEILKDMQFRFGPIDGELATPTGLAIIKNILFEYIEYILDVPITPKRTGYGLGTRVFEDYINIVRVIYA